MKTTTTNANSTTNTAAAFEAIRGNVERMANTRSAWGRGVKAYALDLVANLEEATMYGYFCADDLNAPRLVSRAMLNGAQDWREYSEGGRALIYNGDIAARLCSPSELKRTQGGQREPNSRETWIDVQARALYQAAELVKSAIARAVS